ncbi:hypothetical protein RCL1_001470 [Eukaryota sp. TZLM3-RCL]
MNGVPRTVSRLLDSKKTCFLTFNFSLPPDNVVISVAEPPKKMSNHPCYNHYKLFTFFLNSNEETRFVCLKCPDSKKKTFSVGCSTSTLSDHLSETHDWFGDDLEVVSPSSSQPEASTFTNAPKALELSPKQKETLDNLIIKMFILDFKALKFIDSPSLLNIFKFLLGPDFKFFTRQTLRRRILKLYQDLSEKLLEVVSGQSVSVTTDLWTSINNTPFISLTAHFIDESFNMHSFVTDIRAFGHPHNAERIADVIYRMITDLKVDKYVAITTDNASNMKCGVETINSLFQATDEREIIHQRCLGHIINLAVQTPLGHFKVALTKIRDLSEKLHKSSALKQDLLDTFEEIQRVSLRQDVTTRWSSTYTMIESYLSKVAVIDAFILEQEDDDLSILTTSTEEKKHLKSIAEFLKEFAAATSLLSTSSEPSLSMTVMTYCHLKNFMEEKMNENISKSWYVAVVKSMMAKFEENESKIFTLPAFIACYLDPRIKKSPITGFNNQDLHYDALVEAFHQQELSQYVPSLPTSPSSFYSKVLKSNVNSQRYNEMTYYEIEPLEEEVCNPLSYWKTNAGRFPVLATLARFYFSIQATSVPSERLFSVAGHILTKVRNSVSDDTLEALLCLNSWFVGDLESL